MKGARFLGALALAWFAAAGHASPVAVLPAPISSLHADPPIPRAEFGDSVATDGPRLVVGSRTEDTEAGRAAGAAYVFDRQGSAWVQSVRLVPSGGAAFGLFGGDVDLDGDVVAVASRGEAYVFAKTAAGWSEEARLSLGGRCGAAVHVAVSGNVLAASELNCGVFIFERVGGVWTLSSIPFHAGHPFDGFGSAVAVEGDRVLVGARSHRDPVLGVSTGAAYVFERDGFTWSQRAVFGPSGNVTGALFGSDVALDGEAAIVGAQNQADEGGLRSGAAYVFRRAADDWVEEARLPAAAAKPSAAFGAAVALRGDLALVGAPRDGLPTAGCPNYVQWMGSAYVFARAGPTWVLQAKLVVPDLGSLAANVMQTVNETRCSTPLDDFGVGVDVGPTDVVVGARFHDGGGALDGGAVYTFAARP